MEEKSQMEERKNYFAYFLLFFPTIIIAAIPSTINGGVLAPLSLKLLLAFYQFVSIKNFVDRYYGD